MTEIEIEKYKMLISTMPEDKAKEAMEMLKEAMNEGNDASKALPKVNKFVMQNANVYIVKDQNEIKDKDLTGYGAVMFDCDVKGVTDFSNCPKKMIFNKCVYIESVDEFFYSEKLRGSIDNYNIKKLPDLSESVVIGHFVCRNCDNLTSLEGAPKYVGGNFDCSKCNNLKTLEGAPKYIGSDFDCEGCISLTSLKGVREKVGRDFICTECKNLKSLEGAPEKVGGSFVCDCCVNLKSFVGGPKYVEGNFRYTSHVIRYHREFKHETKLSSFEVMPEYIGGDLSISGCGKKYLA